MGRPLQPRITGLLRRPLDRLFAVAANVPVLRALAGMARGTGREVARRAGIGAPGAHQALARLEDLGLLRRTPAGRAFVFELNREHFLAKRMLLPMLEAETDFREELGRLLVRAAGVDPVSAVIFGSVARGEEGPASDLDVCFVVEGDSMKRRAETGLSGAFEKIWKEFGFKLSAMVFTRSKFVRGWRSGKGFFRNVVAEGDVFAGVRLEEVVGGAEDAKGAGGKNRGRGLRGRRT